MDIFLEYMVKRQKDMHDHMAIFGIIAGACVLTVVLGFVLTLLPSELFLLFFLVIIGIWFGVYILISRRNMEYEYTFTNGELDVDVVYAKKRRVHLLTVRAKEFNICAPVYDERYKDAYVRGKELKKTIQAVSSMSSRDIYFADFYLNGEHARLLFEPSRRMIEAIARYNRKQVHLSDDKPSAPDAGSRG